MGVRGDESGKEIVRRTKSLQDPHGRHTKLVESHSVWRPPPHWSVPTMNRPSGLKQKGQSRHIVWDPTTKPSCGFSSFRRAPLCNPMRRLNGTTVHSPATVETNFTCKHKTGQRSLPSHNDEGFELQWSEKERALKHACGFVGRLTC
jgi:hypothetical protein